jgi:hypothetical protein
MDQAKVKEIFSDEVFVTSLLKLETPEEAQKALKAKGVEMSLDEIKTLGAALEKAAKNGGTLSEAELEKVAGGVLLPAVEAAFYGAMILIPAAGITHLFTRGRW